MTIAITSSGIALDGPLVAGEKVAVTVSGLALAAEDKPTLALLARFPDALLASVELAEDADAPGTWTGELDTATKQTALFFATARADERRDAALELVAGRVSLARLTVPMANSALCPKPDGSPFASPVYVPVPGPQGDPQTPSDATPQMDGAGAAGTATTFARGDHQHPTDTSRAADNAVVHLTGNQQTISAVLQLMYTLYAEDGIESHGDYCLTWKELGEHAGTLTISRDSISIQLANENEPRQYKLRAGGGGTVALLENIAPEFVYAHSYGVGELCISYDADANHLGWWLYRCIAATDGRIAPETDSTHWAAATVEDALAALRTGKQDTIADLATIRAGAALGATAVQPSSLRYAFASPTPTVSGTSATVACDDRAVNDFTVATGITSLTITPPASVAGRARDFFCRVMLTDSSLPTVTLSGGTIDIGASEVAGMTQGVNLLMFTEIASGHWLASRRSAS